MSKIVVLTGWAAYAIEMPIPEFMRPRQYVLLEALPLTPNGELDRAA